MNIAIRILVLTKYTLSKITKLEHHTGYVRVFFNINLLNYDKHPLTEDFLNTLGSFFLEPHILKPTSRITSHSSTLIDNIFFSSIEYQTISGNL